MNQHHSSTPMRRLGVATIAGAVACTGGLLALVGLGGQADALDAPAKFEPVTDDSTPGDVEFIGFDELDEPIYDGPIELPQDDDDGPIYDGPIVTIPQATDGPTSEGPIVTIPLLPPDAPPPPDDPPPPPEPPRDPATTPPTGNASTPPPPPPTQEQQQPTPPESAQVAPFVEITSAAIDCTGMLHVTYDTGATPELAPQNEHVVMFSPASNPAAVMSQRLLGRAVNGTFTVDLQAPALEAYRVFVVADFEPANLDGVALVDEADAPAPTDCP